MKVAVSDVATAHFNRESSVAASIQRNLNWRAGWREEESVCSVGHITRLHFLSGQKRFYRLRHVRGLNASTGRCGTKTQVVQMFDNEENFVCRLMGANWLLG
jgi:hypothetical protein